MTNRPCDLRIVTAARTAAIETLEARTLLSGAASADIWTVAGDARGRRRNDAIVLDVAPGGQLRATVNGEVVGTRAAASVKSIEIWSGRGNDTVRVELGSRLPDVSVSVFGGSGADRLVGDSGSQSFDGGVGGDSIEAGGGDDSLIGGDGDDDLWGGDGNDYISGDAGLDTLGGGDDLDRLLGGRGADYLDGGDGRDKLDGGRDRDNVRGGAGRDAIAGGAGGDRLYVEKGTDGVDRDAGDRVRTDDVRPRVLRVGKDEFDRQMLEAGLEEHQGAFGEPATVGFQQGIPGAGQWDFPHRGGGDTFGASPDGVGGGAPANDQDFSPTNTQIQGVDELDVVETDGRRIYALAGNEVVVTDTATQAVTKRLDLGGGATHLGMYLTGNRLTVISWMWFEGQPPEVDDFGNTTPEGYHFYETQTRVMTFDVSDPGTFPVVESSTLDGMYVTSRAVGDKIYVATNDTLYVPQPQAVSDGHGGTVYETEQQFRARLAARNYDYEVPAFRATLQGGSPRTGRLVSGDDLYTFPGYPAVDVPIVTFAMIDTGDNVAGPVSTVSVGYEDVDVLATRESIYLMLPYGEEGRPATTILKFSLGPDSIDLVATGSAPGNILNSASADDDGQHLRLATIASDPDDATLRNFSNGVSVLDQVGDDLVVVGSIAGVAKGRGVRSARFVGDRAYLAAGKANQPLLTFDLSDPTAPRVAGQLAIPGFADYLQPIDDTHLVGIGRNADTDELEVSLFDVSDVANPQRVGTYTVPQPDGGWATSIAEADRHAIAYFPEKGVLVFPVTDRRRTTFRHRLEVVSVTPAAIAPLGTIEHAAQVWRGVRIGDLLYSVGDDGVRVVRVDNPGESVGVIPF